MTFRARLTLAYLVLLTTALSGFGLWVYAYVDRNLHQEFYGSVERQGNQLAQLLARNADLNLTDQDIEMFLARIRKSLPKSSKAGSMSADELQNYLQSLQKEKS